MDTYPAAPMAAHVAMQAAPNYRPPRKGALRTAWHAIAGEPNEAKKAVHAATSHGAGMLNMARKWAAPMMAAFSTGAAVVLAGQAMQDNLTRFTGALAAGGTPLDALGALNFVAVIVSVVIIVGVIGADFAMMAAATQIRDLRTSVARKGEYVWPGIIVLGVSGFEIITFTLMVAELEHPTDWWQWAYIAGRGAVLVGVANYLATLAPRVPTERDRNRLLEMKATEGLLAYIEQKVQTGTADFGQLMNLTNLLTDHSIDRKERDRRLIEAVSELAPDARRSADVTRAELAAEAQRKLTTALLHVATTGELPAHLVAEMPELGGLTFAASGVKGAAKKAASVKPTSRADSMRTYLIDLGAPAATTPKGKRGVWVKAGTITALTGGKVAGEQATMEARRHGQDTKAGNGYACPVERLMPYLYTANLLTEDARQWWENLQATQPSEGEDAESMAAPIAVGMRGEPAPDSRGRRKAAMQAIPGGKARG